MNGRAQLGNCLTRWQACLHLCFCYLHIFKQGQKLAYDGNRLYPFMAQTGIITLKSLNLAGEQGKAEEGAHFMSC